MPPSEAQLREMLTAQMRHQIDPDYVKKDGAGDLMDHAAKDVQLIIVGEHEHIARDVSGHADAHEIHQDVALHRLVNSSKPIKVEIVHLVFNPSNPWVSAALKNTATTKKGKLTKMNEDRSCTALMFSRQTI